MFCFHHIFISISCFIPSFLFPTSLLNLYLHISLLFSKKTIYHVFWHQWAVPSSWSLLNIGRDQPCQRIDWPWKREVKERQRQTNNLSLKKYNNIPRSASRHMQRHSLTKLGEDMQEIKALLNVNRYRHFASWWDSLNVTLIISIIWALISRSLISFHNKDQGGKFNKLHQRKILHCRPIITYFQQTGTRSLFSLLPPTHTSTSHQSWIPDHNPKSRALLRVILKIMMDDNFPKQSFCVPASFN